MLPEQQPLLIAGRRKDPSERLTTQAEREHDEDDRYEHIPSRREQHADIVTEEVSILPAQQGQVDIQVSSMCCSTQLPS